MKRIILIAGLLMASLTAQHSYAQRLDESTLLAQAKPAKEQDGYKVVYQTRSEKRGILDLKLGRDDDRRRNYRGSRLGTDSRFNLDIGINNYLEDGSFPNENDAPYSVRPWGSWYVGINHTYNTHIAGKFFLDWGGGVSWYNFKFEDERVRLTEAANGVVFAPDTDPTIDPIKSKLTVMYLNLSAIPMFDFSFKTGKVTKEDEEGKVTEKRRWIRKTHDGFRVGVGPYAGVRLNSYTKFVSEEGNDRDRDRDRDDFFLENFRYGLRAQLGYDGIDIFVQYDMNSLFTENRGPQLNAFTFGLTL